MQKRVIFNNSSSRESFFMGVLKQSKAPSWRILQTQLGIPKSIFEYYKRGVRTLPVNRYAALSVFLSKSKKKYFDRHITLIDANLGQIKGGKISYARHKDTFYKGRNMAINKNRHTSQNMLEINIDKELCEFIGAFIGDGFTNKYGSHYLIQFAGDYSLDKKYYETIISPVLKRHFNILPHFYKRGDNSLQVNFYSKRLYAFLIDALGFPAGKKSYTVKIPQKIINSKKELITSLLRGIFDTDGGIFFDKRSSYSSLYPRIHIKLINKPLIAQIYSLLYSFNLNPRMTRKGYVIQINGCKYFKRFMHCIGFSNARHLNRIKNNRPDLLT